MNIFSSEGFVCTSSLAFFNQSRWPRCPHHRRRRFLIFGKRLPEVGKNLGKTIVEFKKGLNGKPLSKTKKPSRKKNAPPNASSPAPASPSTPAASPLPPPKKSKTSPLQTHQQKKGFVTHEALSILRNATATFLFGRHRRRRQGCVTRRHSRNHRLRCRRRLC